ncbi:MAG: sigma-54 dependent transcriptional regulator [Desulfosarcinaceae bacterium]|nr:sigma-54 dependent transcriptional regulator [Desulfosarcinaceae bacterium]
MTAAEVLQVLVVDDEEGIRRLIEKELGDERRRITTADSVQTGLAAFKKASFDGVLLDMRLPDGSGLDLLEHFQDLDPEVQVIVITGHADVDNAVQAMKGGAYDYVTKPFELDHLELLLERACQRTLLQREIRTLRHAQAEQPPRQLVGRSPRMDEVRFLLGKVAPTDVPVLLTGESGTGKTLVAQYLHDLSARSGHPCITKNCGAFQKDLIRSELFGHRRGAFTGAHEASEGLLSFANKGTLFLDEIGEVPMEVQSALLRVIETKTFRRVGDRDEQHVDVRLVFATNRNLQAAVEAGRFSQALYHRINVFNIPLPPLRERKEDIPAMVAFFLGRMASGDTEARVSDRALQCLMAYDWPGNVRELQNVLERGLILSDSGVVTEECLPQELNRTGIATNDAAPFLPLREIERQHIQAVLRYVGDSRTKAAKILGIGRKTLYRKLNA